MPGDAVSARLYGKLPAHGDFVSRGFTRAEAEVCDIWLSAALADTRERHGEAFESRYDQALPWRYAGDGVGGALAPSQDAAGRRFPLYLELSPVSPADVKGVAEAVEELLFHAIAQGWTADALAAAAEAIEPPVGGDPAPEGGCWWLEGGDDTLPGARPVALLAHMLSVEVPA